MITKLQRFGDDLVLVLDRALLRDLGIDEQTPLELTPCEDKLIVARAPEPERQMPFEEALEQTIRKYGNLLRRLADS